VMSLAQNFRCNLDPTTWEVSLKMWQHVRSHRGVGQQLHCTRCTVYNWSWANTYPFIILIHRLLVAASILTLFPRLLLFLSETENIYEQRRSALTPLESFLALHFGIWLAAIAVVLVLDASVVSSFLFNWLICDPQIPSSPPGAPNADTERLPSYHPLLGPLSGAASVTAFISYNTRNVGSLSWMVFVGSTIIGVWGFWTVTTRVIYCRIY
jgi:hypothetical protein